MRSLLAGLLFSVAAVVPAVAHDVTISGTSSFSSLDGSSNDHDGTANGVFTVSDGNLVIDGIVNCNDDSGASDSACAMAFAVSGNLSVNTDGALYAENRSGSGSGGAITLTVGGNLALNGNAIVSTASKSSSGATGGAITANVTGTVTIAAGSTIDSGSANARGGAIAIASASTVTIDGGVLSGPSRTLLSTRQYGGAALDGGSANSIGGAITVTSSSFAEPAVVIGATANIVSQGGDGGAGPITVDGCGVTVRGLVAALSRKDGVAKISIRSGKDVLIDGRDLGGSGTRMGRVRADSPSGTAVNKGVDIFAAETIDIHGPATGMFAVTSLPGLHDTKSFGGLVRVVSLGDAVNGSGNMIDDGHTASGDSGGTVEISAKADVTLDTAVIRAVGDFNTNNPNRGGGAIRIRSYSGDVIWTNGNGEVRPLGSTSNLPLADQGSIVLTACGTIDTTGSTFPVMGVATSPHPQTNTGVCSPAAPSLPTGVAPLITCNTPPVANDAAASTNEDTTVTVTLSATDAEGDTITFSIVSGPFNGTLGPIVPTGPTTATVDYTPNLNYNGGDSFVYNANDGNGGNDTATVTLTIAPVNDAPSFLAGPTATSNEDSGAQTYPNWATAISAGPADESGQTVSFTVTNDNNALFAVQPAVDASGTLTWTSAANAYGSATITIVAQDNGGTANGGVDTSAPQTSSIVVNGVNDEPSFVAGASQTVNEDAGAQSVANWATSISAGPNESGQSVSFVASNDNNALFSTQPSVSPAGTLTYTPAANANGVATVSVQAQDDGGTANGGDDTSGTQTFTITVGAVNDAPSFTGGGDVTVLEDSGAYSAAWASAISAGPADESAQTVTFGVTNDTNALFSAQPAVDASGNLTFTVAADASGSATVTVTLSDNGGTANGGADTSAAQTFTITITAVNDEPSFTSGGDVTVNEDSGAYSASWASAISSGAGESQNVTFFTSNDNNALFASQPAISAAGVLTFTPAADANGSAIVTVYLQDDGGTANGGDDTSSTITFTITVGPVNDAPSFTSGGDVSVLEDSGAYSAPWASGISAGPANEAGQTFTFNVSNSNNALFASQPSIDASGNLTFSLAANVSGTATVTVTLSDNGGTANGGVDTSAAQTFTINVGTVNDAPTFTAGGDVTVSEDSGSYSATWATAISSGPNESGQVVTFVTSNGNNALFSVQPSIDAAGVLTFTPAANAYGTATVSVYAQDNGGTANGGDDTSDPVTFTITVNGVNDPPAAGNDAWETEGNTELRVDHGAGLTPYVGDTTSSGTGVLDNDVDSVEGDPFAITGVVGCADTAAPFVCAVTGGTLTLEANGSFTFEPSAGATIASFQYVVTDQPSAGTPASATGSVTLTIHDMIWYVNGAAVPGGDGTSTAPFANFASLNGVGDVDAAGAYIFVHTSVVNGSIELEASQRLWGEGVGLIIPRNLNGNGFPTTLVAPGTRPNMIASGDAVLVTGVTGVEIAGLDITTPSGNPIDVTSPSGGAAASAAIYSNVLMATGAEGIDINADSAAGTSVSINDTAITSMASGVDLLATAGTVVFSFTNGSVASPAGSGIVLNGAAADALIVNGLSNVTISGNTAGAGISITAARFDANASTAAFETVNAGTIAIGAAGDPVGGAALILTSVSGDLAFGSLSAHGATTGVTVAGTGLYTGSAGMRITSGAGAVSAAAGAGLTVTNTTIGSANLVLTSVSATGGANGILLSNTDTVGGLKVAGSGAAGSGGTIQGTTGDGISLAGSHSSSFTSLNVANTGAHAINASAVSGLTLTNCQVTNAGNGDNEHGMRLFNVSGAVVVNGTTFGHAAEDLINIDNNGTNMSLTVGSGSQFSHGAVVGPFAGNGIVMTARGTTAFVVNVTSSTFTNVNLSAFQLGGDGTSTGAHTVNVTGNQFSVTTPGRACNVNVQARNTSGADVDVLNNTMTGVGGGVVNIGADESSNVAAKVNGNVITNTPSVGILAANDDNSVLRIEVANNTLTNTGSDGIQIANFGGVGTSELDATVTGNTINGHNTNPSTAFIAGIAIFGFEDSACVVLRGNAVTGTTPAFFDYSLEELGGTMVLEEIPDTPATTADSAYILSTNSGSSGNVDVVGPIDLTNGASCDRP